MRKTLSVLIKPTSSNCNLKCSYCFYHDVSNNRIHKNYGIMTEETARKLIDRIVQSTSSDATINIGFQGGEPTLIGISFFKEFIKYVAMKKEKRTFHYALQTNGVLIDEKWCRFFKRNNFLIGLSLDGYESNMNKFRCDANGFSVFERVIEAFKLLKNHRVDTNVLCVLTNSLSKNPRSLYDFCKISGITHLQLIPCLPSLDGHGEEALTPENYKTFFIEFYSIWLKDFKMGHAFSVNLFDNVMLMLMKRPPFQCGINGRCSVQNIIEADGSVFTCDFYVTDEHFIGNIYDMDFNTMANTITALKFQQPLQLEPLCEKCKYVKICNGGCKRQRVCFLNETSCSYRDLLDYMMIELPTSLSIFLKKGYK